MKAHRTENRKPEAERMGAKLPATVVGLGLVSLFTDVSSEAIFPLLPAFLAALGSSGAFIGLVEGAAELTANVLKFVMGRLIDRSARLKPWVLLGYGLSTFVRPLVAFAWVPWHVLLVRVGDRVGKGVRTTPRDALIAAATADGSRARAYGFHRAMDHSGAVLGTLLASGLLWWLGASARPSPANLAIMRQVFLWAALPGFVALAVLVRTREPTRMTAAAAASMQGAALSPALKRVLVALTLFAFANATDAFLIVKAARLGASPAWAPLIWLTLHVAKATTATHGGALADKYGKREALILGWILYAALWSLVGFVQSLGLLLALTAVYGLSYGLIEGAERGLIADLAQGHKRGAAFGAYNLLIGLAALASSTATGAIWDRWGSTIAFCGSASFALLAALALAILLPKPFIARHARP